jgi:hypothetical protein
MRFGRALSLVPLVMEGISATRYDIFVETHMSEQTVVLQGESCVLRVAVGREGDVNRGILELAQAIQGSVTSPCLDIKDISVTKRYGASFSPRRFETELFCQVGDSRVDGTYLFSKDSTLKSNNPITRESRFETPKRLLAKFSKEAIQPERAHIKTDNSSRMDKVRVNQFCAALEAKVKIIKEVIDTVVRAEKARVEEAKQAVEARVAEAVRVAEADLRRRLEEEATGTK